MACTSCHDPHGGDRARQLALETPRGNAVCTACHSALATPDALRAHAHHDPNGRGGTCIACHMPKKNMGLGYELTRYHRIGSPTDRARVENDRPLECALCHTDKSVAEIVTAMERSFGKRFDKGALRALYGDLDANALEATLARGKPHEVVPAMIALADARHASAAFAIAPHLGHEFPLVRYFARDALGKLFGTSCAVDVDNGAADAIRREGHAWVTSRMHSSSASGRASEP
jgi:predicted CXXCH cytochrome family protein